MRAATYQLIELLASVSRPDTNAYKRVAGGDLHFQLFQIVCVNSPDAKELAQIEALLVLLFRNHPGLQEDLIAWTKTLVEEHDGSGRTYSDSFALKFLLGRLLVKVRNPEVHAYRPKIVSKVFGKGKSFREGPSPQKEAGLAMKFEELFIDDIIPLYNSKFFVDLWEAYLQAFVCFSQYCHNAALNEVHPKCALLTKHAPVRPQQAPLRPLQCLLWWWRFGVGRGESCKAKVFAGPLQPWRDAP